jgi:hypothetical protein
MTGYRNTESSLNTNREVQQNLRLQNSTKRALINLATRLTVHSNFERFRNRLYTLKRKNDQRAVLSVIKQRAQNNKNPNLWRKINDILNKQGGKRTTRKNNVTMRRTRKNRR